MKYCCGADGVRGVDNDEQGTDKKQRRGRLRCARHHHPLLLARTILLDPHAGRQHLQGAYAKLSTTIQKVTQSYCSTIYLIYAT